MIGEPTISRREVPVRVAAACANVLGESPVWSVREQALYWTDIRVPALYRLSAAGEVERWEMPELAGSVVLNGSGGVIVGLQSGLDAFDPDTGAFRRLLAFAGGHEDDRTNDARCDRQGRLWFTRMRDFGKASTGGLFRMDAPDEAVELISGVTIPNAICFSPDGRHFYFADTPKESLDCFALANDGRTVRKVGNVIAPGAAPGRPDGATTDSEGYVWNARFGGGCVMRSAPHGREHMIYSLPVSRPTSCSFGGPELNRLFITTARQGLNEAQLAAEPLAGSVLVIEPGVHGLAEPVFAG